MCATYTFLYSFLCIMAVFTQDARLLNGGYNAQSASWGARFGMLGMLFGITGLLGVSDQRIGWVRWYNYFQYVKLIVALFIFIMDMRVLSNQCDKWLFSVDSQIAYNPTLENVARNSLCHWTRTAYVTGFIIDYSFHVYVAYIGAVYLTRMEQLPPHIIWFPGKPAHFEGFNPAVGEPGRYIQTGDPCTHSDNRDAVLKKSDQSYGATA